MALNLGTLLVQLRATTADFKKDMDEAKKAAEGFSKDLKPATLAVGAAFTGLAASIALVAKAAGEDIVSEMRLKSVFGENAAALISYAEAQERSTIFSNDATIAAEQLLGTMGANASQTRALIGPAQDLAALMGTDVSQAAMVMMRAVNNGSQALARSGLAMSETQRHQFDMLNSSGRMAMMLDIIGDKAGGMAAKMSGTLPGAISQLQNALGSFVDELGMGFQDIGVSALSGLADALRGVTDWFRQLSPEAKEMGAKIALVATGALGVVTALGGIGLAMPGLIALFSSFGSVLLGAVLPAIPYILGIAAALAGVILTVGLLRQAWDTNFLHFRDIIEWHIQAWRDFIGAIEKAWGAFIDANRQMIDMIAGVFGKKVDWGAAKQTAGAAAGAVGGAVGTAAGFVGGAFGTGLDTILGPIKDAFRGLFPVMDVLKVKSEKASDGLGRVGLSAEALAKLEESRAAAAQAVQDYESWARGMGDRASKPGAPGATLDYNTTQGTSEGGAAADYAREMAVKERMDQIRGAAGTLALHVKEGVAKFGQVFGATMLSAAGEVGSLIQAGMQGFASGGGPWGALAAVFATLISKTKAFQAQVAHANLAIGQIVEGLEPLLDGITPLVVIVNMLVVLLFGALKPVFQVLAYVFEGLFFVVKYLVLGIAYVVKGIGEAYNFIIETAASLADWFWEDAGDWIRKMKINNAGVDRMIDEWNSATLDSTRASADAAASSDDASGSVSDLGDSASNAATDIEGMTEQLTNVPEGFKIALARYRSISGEGGFSPQDAAAARGGFVNQGTIIIQTDDPEDFEQQLEQKRAWGNYRSGGTPVTPAPAYSGG